MISEKELRVGNYVKGIALGLYIKIDLHFFNSCLDDDTMLDWYTGIKLTPDILEKSGFKKTQEGNMAYPEVWSMNYQRRVVISTIDISIRGSDEICWIEGNTIVELSYLHQLQNLVHALTGEELNVNL